MGNQEEHSGQVIADGGSTLGTEFEPKESTLQALIRRMAAVQDVSESEIDPLSDHVDPEALDSIMEHADKYDRDVRVRFTIDEYTASVASGGKVRISE